MIALDAADDPAAEILHVDDRLHQRVVDVGEEQIGAGRRGRRRCREDGRSAASIVPGASTWAYLPRFLPRIESCLPSNTISTSAKPPVRVTLILSGPAERHRAGTGEVELLEIAGDDRERGVEAERDRLLRAHVVRHRLEERPGVALVGDCGPKVPRPIAAARARRSCSASFTPRCARHLSLSA